MIPEQLRWSLFRRRHLIRTILGFSAHLNTYATPDCQFDDYVSLHKGTRLYSCHLGRATYISEASLSNVSAGKFCSIGQGARIGLGRHPTDFLSTHPAFYSGGSQTKLQFAKFSDFVEAKTVKLGNDVWIGANALVMGGVSIDDGAIIGAGSVVTKNIPAYAIAVGSPAKIVRYRFDERTVSNLLSLQWWNKSDHEIKNLTRILSPNGPIDPDELGRWLQRHLP